MTDAPGPADRLPPLRRNLDLFPSPIEDRPGLFVRDPFRYTDAQAVIPPPLVACLALFDGEHAVADLEQVLGRIAGSPERAGELAAHLVATLGEAGFLEDNTYRRLKHERESAFRGDTVREPAHAGLAYPDVLEEVRAFLDEGMASGAAASGATPIAAPGIAPAASAPTGIEAIATPPASGPLVAIAAPHVSPEGGWASYRAAYAALDATDRDRTFVILGTSHYGPGDRFGLTRKTFVTPLGAARTDAALVEELATAAPGAILDEDYHHAVEHSIEFQVLMLQHRLGPDLSIVPILCGPFVDSILRGGPPEADDDVARFLDALGNMAAREGRKLAFVLGVDMAHMGRRYGDDLVAQAFQGDMNEVARRDRERIERMAAGDASGFWQLVQERQDDLKWCGASPIYAFLRALPGARGVVRHYEQWNIDEASVVSFAGMTFTAP
jgi:AmmeMemoRadiSam system protein B